MLFFKWRGIKEDLPYQIKKSSIKTTLMDLKPIRTSTINKDKKEITRSWEPVEEL